MIIAASVLQSFNADTAIQSFPHMDIKYCSKHTYWLLVFLYKFGYVYLCSL